MKPLETSLGTIVIRQALIKDAESYRALRLEALHQHPEVYSADEKVNLERPKSFWEERVRSLGRDDMIMFAEHEQVLVGMCGIYLGESPKTRHSATIVGVYVKPEFRNLHIAGALIEICVDWARDQGARVVKLAVVTNDETAIHCYRRGRFEVYGTEPQALFYSGIMYDELLMARLV